MTSPAPHRDPSAIDQIAEDFFAKSLELTPEWGVSLGMPGYETAYGDYSPAGTTQMISLLRETLGALANATPVDAIDEVSLDAMTERLSLQLEILFTGRTELNNIA
ncbi:hypothetical protein BZG17_29970, partial [Escherichia coli]|nr:hypothetical protein [Escherichia coli]